MEITRLRHYVPKRPAALGRLHMELSFGFRLLFVDWGKPDVVLLVSPALFSSGLALVRTLANKRRPRTILWVQDIYSRGIVETGGQPGYTSKLMMMLERRVLTSVDSVVAIHERFAQYMVDCLKVSSHSLQVIRNWTHLPSSLTVNRDDARRRLGWNKHDIVALHTGNMGKKQGLRNVVEAARLAEQTGSRVRFVLMGDGNQRKDLESCALGLQRIQFVDSLPQKDFQTALEAADVLLVNELPGVRDMSVPSKLTSYFTSGRPVVAATDAGSVTSEEIAVSGAGVRVDANNPLSLVSTIESLGDDETRCKKLGDKGKLFREQALSEAAAIDRYNSLITSLASSLAR